jgi:uncharacterized membrane protein YhfC
MNTTIVGLLAAQFVVVLVGPVLLALWIRRRFGSAWSSLGWGALTFPLSQLLRIPLLLGMAALVNPYAKEWSADRLFWALVIVLAKRVNTRLNETRNLGRRRSFLGGSAG